MTTNVHHQHLGMVQALFKDGEEVKRNLGKDQIDFWHATTGVVTEACELLDAAKGHVIYGRVLDVNNVIEEMGDTYFYLTAVLQTLSRAMGKDYTLEQCLQANIDKLALRYPGMTYTDAKAQERADKAGTPDPKRKFIGMPKSAPAVDPNNPPMPHLGMPHPDQTSPMTVPPETFMVDDSRPATEPAKIFYSIGKYTVEAVESLQGRNYGVFNGAILEGQPFPDIEAARAEARKLFQAGIRIKQD
jgi:NTP pyrophosphatase (non-canonical NTP hydrolase)